MPDDFACGQMLRVFLKQSGVRETGIVAAQNIVKGGRIWHARKRVGMSPR